MDNKLVSYLLIICTLYCVILLCFITLIILSIGQKGQTPLQAAEQQLQEDRNDQNIKNRCRIISYLKELNENV